MKMYFLHPLITDPIQQCFYFARSVSNGSFHMEQKEMDKPLIFFLKLKGPFFIIFRLLSGGN